VLLDKAWLAAFRAITAVVKTTSEEVECPLFGLLPAREAVNLEHWMGEVLPVLVLTSTEYAQQEQEEVEEIKVERERT
jgi:hypothetical protein